MSTTTTTTATAPPAASGGVNSAFLGKLSDYGTAPLWLQLSKLLTITPKPHATPKSWKYSDLRPLLMEAGELVTAEEAERRVLMLLNPSLKGPFATDSIYAGLQLILPGETAPAHRHSPIALRFIIEGSGGFTAVDGKRLEMERGDVILTPSGVFHDHGNDGNEPVIWLDGLDLPVFQFLPLGFTENYKDPTFPSTPNNDPALRIPWAPVQQVLDKDSSAHSIYHYSLPSGGPLSRTLSAQAERVKQGTSTTASRETVSYVYHVVQGQGKTEISDPTSVKPQIIEWKAKDTFAVPSWSSVRHTANGGSEDAYLFAVNDRPLLESLGLSVKQ